MSSDSRATNPAVRVWEWLLGHQEYAATTNQPIVKCLSQECAVSERKVRSILFQLIRIGYLRYRREALHNVVIGVEIMVVEPLPQVLTAWYSGNDAKLRRVLSPRQFQIAEMLSFQRFVDPAGRAIVLLFSAIGVDSPTDNDLRAYKRLVERGLIVETTKRGGDLVIGIRRPDIEAVSVWDRDSRIRQAVIHPERLLPQLREPRMNLNDGINRRRVEFILTHLEVSPERAWQGRLRSGDLNAAFPDDIKYKHAGNLNNLLAAMAQVGLIEQTIVGRERTRLILPVGSEE